MLVLPADHLVEDVRAFAEAVARAQRLHLRHPPRPARDRLRLHPGGRAVGEGDGRAAGPRRRGLRREARRGDRARLPGAWRLPLELGDVLLPRRPHPGGDGRDGAGAAGGGGCLLGGDRYRTGAARAAQGGLRTPSRHLAGLCRHGARAPGGGRALRDRLERHRLLGCPRRARARRRGRQPRRGRGRAAAGQPRLRGAQRGRAHRGGCGSRGPGRGGHPGRGADRPPDAGAARARGGRAAARGGPRDGRPPPHRAPAVGHLHRARGGRALQDQGPARRCRCRCTTTAASTGWWSPAPRG